jgi:hypothetical protein
MKFHYKFFLLFVITLHSPQLFALDVSCNETACIAKGKHPCPSPASFTASNCGGQQFYVCAQNQDACSLLGNAEYPQYSWSALASQAKGAVQGAPGGAGGLSRIDLTGGNASAAPNPAVGMTPDQIESAQRYATNLRNSMTPEQKDKANYEAALAQNKGADAFEAQRRLEDRQAEQSALREAEKSRSDNLSNAKKSDASYNARDAIEANSDLSDECSNSNKLTNNQADCAGTRSIITGAQVTNFGSQLAGSVTTQIVGAGAAQRAANSQTQSGALRAAASTQDTTAKMQLGIGAVNSILGIAQFYKTYEHSEHSKKIAKGTKNGSAYLESRNKIGDTETSNGQGDRDHGYIHVKSGNEIAENAVRAYDLNKEVQKGELKKVLTSESAVKQAQALGDNSLQIQRKAEEDTRKKEVENKRQEMGKAINLAGQKGMSEQNKISKEAQAGGLLSFMTGAQQLVMGYFNKKGADQTKQAANQLEQAEQRAAMQAAAAFVPPRADSLASSDALGARAPTAITGNGQNSAATDIQAQNQNPIDTTGTDGFGNSQSPENLANVPSGAPSPGAFDPTKGGGGVAQGGGGFAPGGNTTANDQAGKEGPGATAYNDTAGKMDAGGGGRGSAYSGGGGGGGGGNPSINPADMLAQLGKLLPGQEDPNEKKNTSIESYVNRAPAGAGAFVPQSESLFEHVSMAYRQQQKRKAVGI